METSRTSQVALVVKNLPTQAGDVRDTGSIPGLGSAVLGLHRCMGFRSSCGE